MHWYVGLAGLAWPLSNFVSHTITHSLRDSESASRANAYSLKHTFPINTSNPLFVLHTHRVSKGWGKCCCFDSSESNQLSPSTRRSFFFQCVFCLACMKGMPQATFVRLHVCLCLCVWSEFRHAGCLLFFILTLLLFLSFQLCVGIHNL